MFSCSFIALFNLILVPGENKWGLEINPFIGSETAEREPERESHQVMNAIPFFPSLLVRKIICLPSCWPLKKLIGSGSVNNATGK